MKLAIVIIFDVIIVLLHVVLICLGNMARNTFSVVVGVIGALVFGGNIVLKIIAYWRAKDRYKNDTKL